MAPSTLPKELVAYLSAPSTSTQYAADALEEWILYRRSKGDTLFEVSVGLAELEEKTPPNLTPAFDIARYVTSLPDITDLTPPSGVFPMHRSQSPATIVAHLLSLPSPSLEHSREVILEYVLAKETKARDKKPGKGGKGSLSREALEEISARLTEIEEGLMNHDGRRLDLAELGEPRQLGMTLVLSLRMSLSYFTIQELSQQLLKVPLGVGEKILVQHIRRRVAGEGRWGVGKELEFLESLTIQQRPALRPAFRSAKARTLLPAQPTFPVALPAPSKSGCIKLIQSFASDTGVSPSTYFSRRGFAGSSTDSHSPKSPVSPLPLSPTSLPADPNRLAEYTKEVVTEFLTREKREYMLKTKWARTGREQLSKDLGDIEQSLCLVSKQQPGPMAQPLVPVFLELRRTFVLPNSPLPTKLIDAFADLLPAEPDPDDVPFREPSLQTATSSLYVNPRLEDSAAFEILQELVTYEKEILQERGMDDVSSPLVQIVGYVEKRFPDGSYNAAFTQAKQLAANNGVSQIAAAPAQPAPIVKQPSMHRRVRSHFDARPTQSDIAEELSPPPTRARQHSRSTSMPHRRNTVESLSDSDESIGIELTATHQNVDRASMAPPPLRTDQPPTLPPLSFVSPIETNVVAESGSTSAGGWWDIVSAVQPNPPSAPWRDNFASSTRKRTTSGGLSTLPLPPGAEPAAIHQVEPLSVQLQSMERGNTPGASSRSGSAPGTPARLPQAPLPTTEVPSPSRRPDSGSSSPHIDFSKRQSDATLNEELGNLMISPNRTSSRPVISPPSTARLPMLSPPRSYMTPGGSPRYPSETVTPQTGSPSRAFPIQQPALQRGQTDISEVRLNDTDSDEDSDDEQPNHRSMRPPQPVFNPPQYQTMAQTTPRPSPGPPSAQAEQSTVESDTPPKSKSRKWKAVSAAMGITKDKDKEKEKEKEKHKEKEKENEKVVRTGNRSWPENDPGRWNKNMVANIMGPPAERR